MPSVRKRLVKPDGFVISPGATEKHNISNCMITADGQLLRDVLCQMLKEACACCDAGGRVAAHHIGLDAIIVFYGLERAGLNHLQEKWANMGP